MFSGEKLKKIWQEKGYSQADLAKLLQLSRDSYFNWENGKTKPNQKNLKQLSQIFKVDPTYFLSEHDIVNIFLKLNPDNQVKLENYAEELLKEQEIIKPLPKLYAYKVFEKLSAGTGYSYFGDGNYDTVFYDEQLDYDFASWVFGDSMEPTYLNGEVVLIKQTGFDYDGAIYAVDWDGQTYIKKVYREEEGLRLVSLNNHYADKFVPYDENPHIIGKIIGNFKPLEV